MEPQDPPRSVNVPCVAEERRMHVSYEMNAAFIENATLEDLISVCHKNQDAPTSCSQKETELYYRDVVNLGIRIHDKLKSYHKCSCAMMGNVSGQLPVCCVLVPSLKNVFRRSMLVLPEEALFLAEDEPERDDKKAKPPKTDLRTRNLCLTMLFKNDSCGRIEFHHFPMIMRISTLEAAGMFISNYNKEVAEEVWNVAVKHSAVQWKDTDSAAKDLSGGASYEARRRAHPAWFAIDPTQIWEETIDYLRFSNAKGFSSGFSLMASTGDDLHGFTSFSSSRRAEGRAQRSGGRGGREEGGYMRQAYDPVRFNYSIIRDCVLQSAMNFQDLIQTVDKAALGKHEEAIETPSDASRISDASFIDRRVFTDYLQQEEPESRYENNQPLSLVYSIQFFYAVKPAREYGMKYRLPMFAQDKTVSGKKYFYVAGSWHEAYRAIRFQKYRAPPPNICKSQWDKERKKFGPSYHELMHYSHECYGGPRRVKLFLDLDGRLESNPQFMDPDTRCVDMEKVNRMTRATITWFTDFVNSVFGEGTCSTMDWVVMCATDATNKISRHVVLDKPGCYFNTMMDLMTFMYLAEIEQTKAFASRNLSKDYTDDATSCISWMVRKHDELDPLTHAIRSRTTSVVDFSVYNKIHGNMRCVFCPKMSDPDRVLNPLLHLFPGDKWTIVDSRATHPDKIPDLAEREKHEEDEFAYFLRSMVTYVERTEEQKKAKFEGWRMPVGDMLCVEETKVTHAVVANAVSDKDAKGEDSMDGNHKTDCFSKAMYFLASVPKETWYETSTIPKGVCMMHVRRMIQDYLHAEGVHRGASKRKTYYGGIENNLTVIVETDNPNGIIKTIKAYIANQNAPGSGHHLYPWKKECKSITGDRRISTASGKLKTREELKEIAAKEYWDKERNGSGVVLGLSARRGEEEGPKEAPLTKQNRKDLYTFKIHGTSWCPVREHRLGREEGHHRSGGSGILRIYRDGRVEYGCLNDVCKANIQQVNGLRGYYWRLPYLSSSQRKRLWEGV